MRVKKAKGKEIQGIFEKSFEISYFKFKRFSFTSP
jgi:hypothetical protein